VKSGTLTPLKRSPLKRVSAKGRAKATEWAKVCAKRLALCKGYCERCGWLAHLQGHHRLPRSQGGKNTDANCRMLCAECHSYVHANPATSYLDGWLLLRREAL
jgi:5-methylcytosine-specific restriction endonuclease McrA